MSEVTAVDGGPPPPLASTRRVGTRGGGVEGIHWSDRPSLWYNISRYLIGMTIVLFAIFLRPNQELVPVPDRIVNGFRIVIYIGALFFMFSATVRLLFVRYTITSDRVLIQTGVLNRVIEQIELFRVRDISVHQPMMQGALGMGTVWIVSADRTTPYAVLFGLRNAPAVAEALRHAVAEAQNRIGFHHYEAT